MIHREAVGSRGPGGPGLILGFMSISVPPPLPNVILARNHPAAQIRAELRAGRLRRISRGAYLLTSGPGERWQADLDTHLGRCLALTTRLGDEAVLTDLSAAAVHGLWVPSLAGAKVHVGLTAHAHQSARQLDHQRHRIRITTDDVVEVNGLRVTSIRRTVVDCARTLPAPWALAVADCGMRRLIEADRTRPEPAREASATLRSEWIAMLEEECSPRGRAQARAILTAADPLSESPNESRARCLTLGRGLPQPTLQYPVQTHLGTFFTDLAFKFPTRETTYIVHLEVDGVGKYTSGTTLVREKSREDAIRSPTSVVVRAVSDDLHPSAATAFLDRLASQIPASHRRHLTPNPLLASPVLWPTAALSVEG